MGAKSRGNWNLPFCLKTKCVHHGTLDCAWCRHYSMLKLEEDEENAAKKRKVEESRDREYQRVEEVGEAAETGGGNCAE